jgi:hypothetical protein
MRPGGPELGAALIARAAEFHPLEDYFRFYKYPPDLITRAEATEPHVAGRPFEVVGRPSEEAASRFGIDLHRLHAAALEETVTSQADAAGDLA